MKQRCIFIGKVLLVLVAVLSLVACGGKKPSGPQRAFEPDWYMSQDSTEFIFVYGNAQRANRQAAETSAYSNAMADAARTVEAQVQSMMRDFMSESGVDNPQILSLTEQVVRVTSNQRFSGTQRLRSEVYGPEDGTFNAFVQVGIPRAEVNRDMMNRIRNEEAMYNEFKASQAFSEMDRVLGL